METGSPADELKGTGVAGCKGYTDQLGRSGRSPAFTRMQSSEKCDGKVKGRSENMEGQPNRFLASSRMEMVAVAPTRVVPVSITSRK